MSLQDRPPALVGGNWQQWAQRLVTWLAATRSALRHKGSTESAAENGVLLWDRSGYPVISKNGAWVELSATETLNNPVFTYTAGVLTLITYGSGTTKALTYTAGALTQIVNTNSAGFIITKTLNYTNGVLTSVTEA
mgnify:CR=1 FL=1